MKSSIVAYVGTLQVDSVEFRLGSSAKPTCALGDFLMELADFPASARWLRQFDDEDQDAAKLLLRRLRCISPNAFSAEVGELFAAAADTLPNPIAIYAARELDDGPYFINKRNRPVAVVGNSPVGSEGSAAYMATALAREKPDIFLNHPPIATLKRRKCRTIAICDDCCGSGKRVFDFISEMLTWKTLKSWLSGGFIRFHVFAFAISGDAKTKIMKAVGGQRPMDYVRFHYCQNMAIGAQLWSGKEKRNIEDLCNKYGKQKSIRNYYWRGFGDQLSTLVFAHSCPNNTPGILWEKTKSWEPLFPNRSIPQEFREAFTDEPNEYQQALVLQRLDAGTIASNQLFVKGSQRDRDMLVVLASIRFGCRGVDEMSKRGGLPLRRVEAALSECLGFGLVDDQLQLTKGGRDALRVAERETIRVLASRETSHMYFPSQLRPRGGQ